MFSGNLIVRVCFDGPRTEYELQEPFAFISREFGPILVPVMFRTDFGSVPRCLEWIVSGEDKHLLQPAIVHDYLYARQGNLPDGRVLTRRDADRVLVEGMRALGASWGKCRLVANAVRIGGAKAWNT